MPSVRLRSKKQIKTKKNGGASVVPKPGNAVQEKSLNRFGNQEAYCRLGEIPIHSLINFKNLVKQVF